MSTDRRRKVATYQDFQRTKNFGALDALRALSVIAVIWQHTSGNPGPEFFSKGGFGVDMFFAISGFLITTLLLRERRRKGRISLKGFYIRRVFRIMPIYYVVLAAYVALTVLTQRGTPASDQFLSHLPAFLTYTSNWFVDLSAGPSVTFYFAWSLATEEQYYLFWPPLLVLLMFLGLRKGGNTLSGPLIALAMLILVSQIAMHLPSGALIVTIAASLALPILLGSAAALLLDAPAVFERMSPLLSARWFPLACFAAIVLSLIWPTPEQLTQVLMVAAVASVCITEDTLLHPVLRWRPLAYVGTISYGMYLMHMLCANVIREFVPGRYSVLLFVLTTALVIAVASVSKKIFEDPLQRLGRRLSTRVAAPGKSST
ncbi:MAG: acyltransferase family protein [Galactobacter sp.]